MAIEGVRRDRRRYWRKYFGRLGTCAGLIFVCAIAFAYGLNRKEPPPNHGLVADSKSLDFGSMWEGSRHSWDIPITNSSNQTCDVLDFTTSCSCTSLRPRSFAISPGETLKIRVELNLEGWPAEAKDRDERTFQAVIVPLLKGSKSSRELGWTITGQVRKLVRLSPANLLYPEGMVAGGPFTPLSVKAQFATSVEGLTATCDSKHVAITVEGSGQFFDLKVQPTTDIPPGLLDTKIRLSAKTSEQTFPVKSIPLKAIIHNAVETSPARISFGAASLGETRTQIVTLSSRNGKTFFVDKVDSEGDSLVVQPLEANSQLPASEQAFRISQKITQMGNQNTCAKFYISVESGAKVEVTCPVQYHGIGASKRKN